MLASCWNILHLASHSRLTAHVIVALLAAHCNVRLYVSFTDIRFPHQAPAVRVVARLDLQNISLVWPIDSINRLL